MFNGFPDNFKREDEDVLSEFRQKQVNFDIEERRNEINNSRSLFIGALAGLIMAGVVGWFVLAPQYQSDSPADVPVIRRPVTVIKEQPSEPADVEIAHQEKTVYDIIEKRMEGATVEETILPPAEEPNVAAIETLIEEVSETGEIIREARVESLTTRVVETAPVMETPAEEPEPVKEVVVEPKKEAPAVAAVKGAWQIQLMSSPNRVAVEKAWDGLVKKYNILSKQPHEVEAADLGAKGMFYRLKAGNFATKTEADNFCNELKSLGGSCFSARK